MSKRYFRGPHEPGSSDLEYVEFTDGWPTRQVDIVDGRYYTSLDEPVLGVAGGLADQSLCDLALPDDWEIPAEEFEAVWQRALAARGIER
jgi:hypothetical protein